MTIKVRVIPRSKKTKVEDFSKGLKVYVIQPAIEQKANKELVSILSKYYNIRKSNISIIKGFKSRDKVVEIRETNRK